MNLIKHIIKLFYNNNTWNVGLITFLGIIATLCIPLLSRLSKYMKNKKEDDVRNFILDYNNAQKSISELQQLKKEIQSFSISKFISKYKNSIIYGSSEPINISKMIINLSDIKISDDYRIISKEMIDGHKPSVVPYNITEHLKTLAIMLGFNESGLHGRNQSFELSTFSENKENALSIANTGSVAYDYNSILICINEISNLLSKIYNGYHDAVKEYEKYSIKLILGLWKQRRNKTAFDFLTALEKRQIKHHLYWATIRQKKKLKPIHGKV